MRIFLKLITLTSLFLLSSIFSPIKSFEEERLVSPLNKTKNSLIASRGNVRTVITIGYGKTVDEASQNAAEIALKQVVGSFIDSETLIKKKKEISNGIVKLSKTIKRDIQDYSQGIIKYFEVLNTEERNGIFIVEAKVEVLEGEFSNYIKEFAFAESSFPGDQLSIMIETNLKNNESKAELIKNKILKPIEEGSVYDIQLGKVIFASNWKNFCKQNEKKFKLINGFPFCNQTNLTTNYSNVIIVPVSMKLDNDFLKNIENILENIKTQKFRVNSNTVSTSDFLNIDKSSLLFGLFKSNNSVIYLINDVKKIIASEQIKKYPNSSMSWQSHPVLRDRLYINKTIKNEIGAADFGGPIIRIFDSNNVEIDNLQCNVYRCAFMNENINLLQVSYGVDPKYSLFGCHQYRPTSSITQLCIPTIITESNYLIVLSYPGDTLKTIKNIKIEYKDRFNY